MKIKLLFFSRLYLTAMLMLSLGHAWAQERTVSGKITAEDDGAALPGVNVIVKGTTSGTVTDSNGDFTLSVPRDGGILVFSFIGLQSQEIELQGKTTLTVSMKADATQLDEVVVTAGGLSARTKELGSANTLVTPQVLGAGKAVNVAAGLQGKVAGFQINATSSGVNPEYRLILRGQRSMTGNNQALIVLDNVIVPSSVLSNMNMNDVESVNVLQGAGAAALYGSQASNGAVLITTKKGKNGKTEINVSQNVQVSQVAFFPKIQKRFGSGGAAYGTDAAGNPRFNYLENQSYGPAFDGSLRPLGPKLEDGSQLYTTYDYKPGHADFWQLGLTNQTDFSISSGDDRSSFYISGQYVTVSGTTPGDKFTRGNVRINGTRKLGDKIAVSYATSYAPNKYDISSATAGIYTNMLNMPSHVDITKFKDWRNDPYANPNGFYNPWYLNPYFTADNARQYDKNTYLTGNLELKFSPIEGLDLIAREGISTRLFSQKTTNGAFRYSDYAKGTDQSSKTNIAATVGETSNSSIQLVTDFIAQYNHNFGDFNLNVVGGTQFIENSGRYLAVGIGGLIVDDLYNLNNGTGNPFYAEADYKTRLMGVYGKVTVGYKDFLFLTGTARNDWDSRLNQNNRSFFYPSAEASFVVSDAFPSIKDSGLINFLKLRASASKTGLVNLGGLVPFSGNFSDFGAYYTLPTFESNTSYLTPNGFPYGSLAGYSVGNRIVSKDIKPELTHGYELGLDMNFLDDRITTVVSYFGTKTNNQTVETFVSNSTGFRTLLTNVGETTAEGVEVTLNLIPIRTSKLEVSIGGNYRYLENKVTQISDLLPQLALQTSGSAVSAAVAGKPFPVIMGLDYERDGQGRVIVDRTTGLPSSTSTNVILGNATPYHILGANGAITYNNLKFSILFEYRGGYNVFNGIGSEMDWSGTGYRTAMYDRKSFVYPNSVYMGDDGNYVANTTVAIGNGAGNSGFWSDGINRNTTSNYVTSGNFVKLREVSLSYSVPATIVSMVGGRILKGAEISLQGRNLFLWMAKDNYYTDPEYSTAGSTGNGMGLNDIGQTPPTRSYGATLSLKL